MIRSMLLLSAVCCLLSSSASVASAQMPSVMPGTGPIKPRPATIRDTSSDDQQSQSDKEWKLGLTLVEGGKGVPCKVVEVFADSPAARIGFRKGDVLITINGDIADDPLNVRNTIFAEDKVSWFTVGDRSTIRPMSCLIQRQNQILVMDLCRKVESAQFQSRKQSAPLRLSDCHLASNSEAGHHTYASSSTNYWLGCLPPNQSDLA